MANLPNGRPYGQKLCGAVTCDKKAITRIKLECDYHELGSPEIRCERHFQNLVDHTNRTDCCVYRHSPV